MLRKKLWLVVLPVAICAAAALFAIEKYFADTGITLPVIASLTITDASGRTLSGQTVEAAWNAIAHAPLDHRVDLELGPRPGGRKWPEQSIAGAGLPPALDDARRVI